MSLYRRFAGALLVLLLIWPAGALADVNLVWSPNTTGNRNEGAWVRATDSTLVVTGSTFSTGAIVQFGTLAATAPVYLCFADVPIGQADGCPTPGSYTQERYGTKSQAALAVVTPPPPPPPPPPPSGFTPPTALRCRVDIDPTNHGEAETTDGRIVAFGYCDDAQGFQWRTFARNPLNLEALVCLNNLPARWFTQEWLTAAWNACATREQTATEKATAAELYRRWAPRFAVTTGATSRPVYLRNADGTRGARVTLGGVAQSIAPGLACGSGADSPRLAGTTRYMEVAGQLSTTGAILPAGSYAQCSRLNPPADGWP
ncbi:MAG: hypothetical protein E6Q97_33570 [Desulfurellales bacterium]|nr:MAG: hypothetical protein E6Q97_33570 [Desulfurellales bacterium]